MERRKERLVLTTSVSFREDNRF